LNQNGLFRLSGFGLPWSDPPCGPGQGFCLPVRRACAAAQQADGTQTGNLFVIWDLSFVI